MRRNLTVILAWVPVCAVFYFPLLSFLQEGILFSLKEFGDLSYWKIIWTTISYSILTALICAVLSTPVAMMLSFRRGTFTEIIRSITYLPFIVNPLVIILGWIVLLRDHGAITELFRSLGGHSILYSPAAVITGMVYLGIPVMVFFLSSRLKIIDISIIQAAAMMGASRTQIYWRILLPLSIQGYGYGCLIVFLSSCGFFIIPALLGGGQITFVSTLIDQMVNRSLDWSRAAQLSLMLLLSVFFVAVFFGFLIKSYLKRYV